MSTNEKIVIACTTALFIVLLYLVLGSSNGAQERCRETQSADTCAYIFR